MDNRVDALLEQARELPVADRERLANSLYDTLSEAPEPGYEDAWRTESIRRIEEIRSGAVVVIPWTDLRAQLASRLRK
jgi:putative addiction module component (TIGR02574 family)